MALQQIHGPVTMTIDPEDSTLTGVANLSVSGTQTVYKDGAGWIAREGAGLSTGGLTSEVRAEMDGVIRLLNERPSAFGIASRIHDDLTSEGLLCHFSFGLTGALVYDPTYGYFDSKVGVINTFASVDAMIRTRVGWIRNQGGNIQIAPADAASDTEFVTVYTLSPSVTTGINDHWSLGPNNIAYYYPNGAPADIVAFDYVQETEVFPNTTNTNRWTLDTQVRFCYYSRKFDTFMTYEEDALASNVGLLKIFSNELVPNALSAPTADPAVEAGVVSTISVTLTDDNSVGIRDRLIDWSITAGNGDLLDTQTTTDENGIATTQYRAPITGGVNPTIEASLTY